MTPKHRDQQKNSWSIPRYAQRAGYKEIKKNGEFVLPGFGKLVKQKRKAHGFNPKRQQKIKIPAKTVFKFRIAKAAKPLQRNTCAGQALP